jgi:site-specific recombinase XerD
LEALADLADEWVLTLGTVSRPTVTVYARAIRQFRDWMATAHPDIVEPGQVSRRHVDGWLAHLTDQGRSEGTRRVRLIALRLFFEYLLGEPDIPVTANPADRVPLPTPKDKVVPVIADADLIVLLAVCGGASFADLRDTAMLRVLIDTGCRRAELAGLDVADVDLRAQDLRLRRTKGGHERVVPVGAKTALALRKYLRARGRHRAAATEDALFLATRPAGGEWRMSGGGIAAMLTRRCALAGLPPFHPHQFRHTWAHDQLAHGAQESDVERLAGWRSPTMVRRYGASAASQRARDAARRLARGDRV